MSDSWQAIVLGPRNIISISNTLVAVPRGQTTSHRYLFHFEIRWTRTGIKKLQHVLMLLHIDQTIILHYWYILRNKHQFLFEIFYCYVYTYTLCIWLQYSFMFQCRERSSLLFTLTVSHHTINVSEWEKKLHLRHPTTQAINIEK